MNVLVLNCGSACTKFAVVHATDGHVHVAGKIEPLGSGQSALELQHEGRSERRTVAGESIDAALRTVHELLRELGLLGGLLGIGHRVVHGGAKFSTSILITPEVITKIKECIPLGPLHNPWNVRGIEVAHEFLPELPQVAVFDTAFHQTMPPRSYLYAVPYAWFLEHEVRRYGFHGTSHRYVSELAVKQLGLDPDDHAIVTAHLGKGCSLAAVRNGQSLDTTMGLTPLEGVVMDTRSGNIDPSIIAHMKKQLSCSMDEVMEKLNEGSGLLGISGVSKDMLTLERAADSGNERARLAIDKFCYSVSKAAAGMFVSLGRVDALVFTGGIGENQAKVRAQIIGLLSFAGFALDPKANEAHGRGQGGRITRSTSPMAAVIPTNEEFMIARDTAEIVARESSLAARWGGGGRLRAVR
ncbi:acetate kinase [Anaeromyxobacter dehalogenans 2CP-1]|uniref:Acetate kinase n=1 Tax=Anaeromyxobacter dehalogenans (strain ATCC BAA-258 / DSM 21875 / 2CP-1) TaxID=455488 RepID=B8J9I1_ANAD2|nr:acetate kinase [Anaeromyxobacter dehalogenans]ACL67369.1 acetate kinase [Anaeromyxobacter dehalogenans 2CP-1]